MGVETIQLVGLGLSAAGFVGQSLSQRKAQKQAKAASAAQARQQKLEQAMQRRRQAREARAAIAAATNAAALQGAGESTVATGTVSALQSQLSGNLSFLNQSEFLIDQANRARLKQSIFEGSAATFGGVSDLGFSVFQNAKEISNIGRSISGPLTTGQPARKPI